MIFGEIIKNRKKYVIQKMKKKLKNFQIQIFLLEITGAWRGTDTLTNYNKVKHDKI